MKSSNFVFSLLKKCLFGSNGLFILITLQTVCIISYRGERDI